MGLSFVNCVCPKKIQYIIGIWGPPLHTIGAGEGGNGEEADPMMHWRTWSVIEWSSPIHWWWNTWTQTFQSFPALSPAFLPSLPANFCCCTLLSPMGCTGYQLFFRNTHSISFSSSLPLGTKKRPSQLLPPPNLQVLKVCMRHVKMHNQCNIQGLCVRVCVFHTCIMCWCKFFVFPPCIIQFYLLSGV